MADLAENQPNPGRGRPVPTTTPLGRVIAARGLRVYQVAGAAGISPRTLSDLLAGRKEMSLHHRAELARVLGVPGNVL